MRRLPGKLDKITAEGGTAKAYKANVLDRANLDQVHEQVLADFGPCDVLINGAGGNNPVQQQTMSSFEAKDMENCKTFFDLDKDGVEFVFALTGWELCSRHRCLRRI